MFVIDSLCCVVKFRRVIGDREVKKLISDQDITNYWSGQNSDILVESESFFCRSTKSLGFCSSKNIFELEILDFQH